MAKIIENEKGFKVIKCNVAELAVALGGYGICDMCNKNATEGYLVAVLSDYCCAECYGAWMKRATNYDDDKPVEQEVFIQWLKMFKDAHILVEPCK